MTTMIINPSKALSLLSNMYLCKPSKDALENWKVLLAEDDSIFLQDLKDGVQGIDTSSETELDELVWEYTQLFIGPYRLPCPPWESVYTSPKRLLMQDAAAEVQEMYRAAGLTVNSLDILPDHLGAELNFLAVLFEKMSDETENKELYIDMIQRFFSGHLMKWVPRFTHDMEEAADSPFYKALARTTRKLLETIGE
jgi:TorA maturation chaperone TorD